MSFLLTFMLKAYYLKKNLLKNVFDLKFLWKWSFDLKLFKKLKSIWKFLNRTSNSIPIENSKPAKANKKKEIEYRFKSSIRLPLNIDITYNITQTNSEKSKTDKKLNLLKKKIIKEIQKTEFQKINQDCNFKNILIKKPKL